MYVHVSECARIFIYILQNVPEHIAHVKQPWTRYE